MRLTPGGQVQGWEDMALTLRLVPVKKVGFLVSVHQLLQLRDSEGKERAVGEGGAKGGATIPSAEQWPTNPNVDTSRPSFSCSHTADTRPSFLPASSHPFASSTYSSFIQQIYPLNLVYKV